MSIFNNKKKSAGTSKPTYYNHKIHRNFDLAMQDLEWADQYNRKVKSRNTINSIWVVICVLIVVALAVYGYTKRDAIAGWMTDRVTAATQKTSNNPTPVPTDSGNGVVPATTGDCEPLKLITNSDGLPALGKGVKVEMGKCYAIDSGSQEMWKKLFTEENNVAILVNRIQKSGNSLTRDQINSAIQQSLETYILDLR